MRYAFYLLLLVILLPGCDSGGKSVADDTVNKAQDTETFTRKDSVYYMGRYADNQVKDVGWKVRGLRMGTWRHYNDNAELVSMAYYYKGKKVADMDTADFNTTSVVRQGVFVRLPRAWEESSDTEEFVIAVKWADTSQFKPRAKIMKINAPITEDLEDYAKSTIEEFKAKYPDFKLLSKRQYKKGRNEAYELFALMTIGEDKVGYLGTFIKHGSKLYFVTCMAQDDGEGHFMRYMGVFNEIVESINFRS